MLAHTMILRWVQRYVPDFEKRWREFARPVGGTWRCDEIRKIRDGMRHRDEGEHAPRSPRRLRCCRMDQFAEGCSAWSSTIVRLPRSPRPRRRQPEQCQNHLVDFVVVVLHHRGPGTILHSSFPMRDSFHRPHQFGTSRAQPQSAANRSKWTECFTSFFRLRGHDPAVSIANTSRWNNVPHFPCR